MLRNPSLAATFFELTPDRVLESVESEGYTTTGRYRFLNSYENRVFDIELEDTLSENDSAVHSHSSLIAKFYRPQRWSQEQILEEHEFLSELQAEGLPVAPPLLLKNQSTLQSYRGLWMALFPKIRGRLVEEILTDQVSSLGRWLARLHNVGSKKRAKFRPTLYPQRERLEWLKEMVPIELWPTYNQLASEVFDFLEEALPQFQTLRVHGDFHRGNLLWKTDWTLIDFDDFLMAPAAQDLWLILTQLDDEQKVLFIQAYKELRDWDPDEMYLLEPLRAYRIIHYSTWIAERWSDPSFPQIFPAFRDYNFWASEILSLQKITNGA